MKIEILYLWDKIYERQATGLADVLAWLNAERAELANRVDKEHPALAAFAKYPKH